MVGELLAARGIIVSHETVLQWARKFGQPFANQIVVACRGLATIGIWFKADATSELPSGCY
jgi:glycerol kinase